MKRFVLIALACFAAAGCKKMMDGLEKQGYESGHQKDKSKPEISNFTDPRGVGASGFGAEQAVRQAAIRDDLLKALEQIRLFIDTASFDGNMPSVQDTFAALQREAPKYAKMVSEGRITLHPATRREDVWAYAKLPQGPYAVASASGIQHPVDEQTLNFQLGR